jgi:deoxyadenosine/deoxycytidine kinase
MSTLIAVVGVSGAGKTALVRALAKTGMFATAFEQHTDRPYQALFKTDNRFALANQIDYLLLRAEQEKELRSSHKMGLIDGGLDLDFHGFTRLFHSRGLLTRPEFDLCLRLYRLLRESLPPPERIIAMDAPRHIVSRRLASRNRINIASAEDAVLLDRHITEWLDTLPRESILRVDSTLEDENYSGSVHRILNWIGSPAV